MDDTLRFMAMFFCPSKMKSCLFGQCVEMSLTKAPIHTAI